MTALSALIAKLEAAREGSRELDAEIFRYLNADNSFITGVYAAPDATFAMTAARGTIDIPHYTTSLDVALAEMPEGWNYQLIYTTSLGGARNASIKPQSEYGWVDPPRPFDGYAATMPLALIIAILKAKEATQAPSNADNK